MTTKIKNWEKFQHFKDRKPPWIKLYRDILDDIEWHQMDGDDAKMLVMLWLIGSENDGALPTAKELAFRLRTTEKSIKSTVSRLGHWLRQDDIKTISDDDLISGRYQDDGSKILDGYQNGISAKALTRSQETETETETENGFALFWSAYPKKTAKPAAEKAFKAAKINGHLPEVLKDIESRSIGDDWTKNSGQFVPNPATYLNQRRWEDGGTTTAQSLGVFL
jgi:hypothetical protein